MFEAFKAKMREREKQEKLLKIRRRFFEMGQAIDAIDEAFEKNGINRQKRRQFWNNFVNDREFRAKFCHDMERQSLMQ